MLTEKTNKYYIFGISGLFEFYLYIAESFPIRYLILRQVFMDKPKKEPTLLRHKPETKLCLNCGFPNRESDKHCMYCKTSMLEETGLISWVRQTYLILRWRQQIKQRCEKVDDPFGSNLYSLKNLGYFIIGVILGGAGLYLFANAVLENSFSSGIVAVLFLFYGIFTLRSLFIDK